jgi:hypothetical protein
VNTVTIPTTAFANAVLANVQAKEPNEYSTYQKLFGLWAAAPGAGSATPIANSSYCNALVLTGYNPKTQPCAARFNVAPTALGTEWILAFRIDQKLGDKDQMYFRYKLDRGLQPTHVEGICAGFNALSSLRAYDAQAL